MTTRRIRRVRRSRTDRSFIRPCGCGGGAIPLPQYARRENSEACSNKGGYDINSNCVAPGWVESEAVLSGDRWKTYLPQIPSRRLGKLSEIAESCVFLCNDKVSYINGEILDVNGAIIMD